MRIRIDSFKKKSDWWISRTLCYPYFARILLPSGITHSLKACCIVKAISEIELFLGSIPGLVLIYKIKATYLILSQHTQF